jgi:hypothetical protein
MSPLVLMLRVEADVEVCGSIIIGLTEKKG